MPFSVVITTFNSARTLPQCLASVAFADDIVVLDSQSTDATLALARASGARLFSQPFKGYALQKAEAVALAAHDWILLLDSDEHLASGSEAAIRNAISCDSAHGYTLPRIERIFWRYQHRLTRPNRFLRLFDRRYFTMSQQRVHESPQISGAVGELDICLIHEGDVDIAGKVEKLNKYSTLQLSDIKRARSLAVRMTIYPIWYFMRSYFLRRQCMSGWAGFINSVELAHYAFLKYAKRYEVEQAVIQKYNNQP